MDKPLGVVREYYASGGVSVNLQIAEAVIRGSGDLNVALMLAPYQMDDDVLLQHIVVSECLGSRLKEVHPDYACSFKEELPKRSIVRTVAKTSRDNSHYLAIFSGERDCKSKECGIEIHRLDTGLSEHRTVMRVAIDFLVGGIQDYMSKLTGSRIKQTRSMFDEIAGNDPQAELLCLIHTDCLGENCAEFGVYLVCVKFNGIEVQFSTGPPV